MEHFLTVIAHNQARITYCLFWTISVLFLFLMKLCDLSCINSGSQDRIFLLTLLLVILMVIFFLILPSFCKKFRMVWTQLTHWFGIPDLGLFQPWVFLSLDPRDIYYLVASLPLLVNVAAGRDLNLGLNLDSEGFFDRSVSTIQVSAFFIDF